MAAPETAGNLETGRRASPRPRRPAAARGRPWAEALLFACGLLLALTPLWARLYAQWQQERLLAELLSAQAQAFPSSAAPGAATGPADDPTLAAGLLAGGPAGAKPAGGVSAGAGAPVRPLFLIEIPRIGLGAVVVAGVGTAELRAGPGLYPGSPAPGAEGNVAIAAHRTTYGAWFRNLDRLRPGDTIRLLVGGKSYVYRVERSWTVRPDAVWVLAPTTYPALTLTTCTPPGSAAFRLVVRARLTSRP